jgi:uncharacterized protein YraI
MRKLNRKLWLAAALLVVLAAIVISGAAAQETGTGYLRFVQAIPGVAAVDVYVNDQLTATGLDYGESTGYIQAPAGEHQLTVRPQGLTTELWSQTIIVADGVPQTLIASSLDPLQFNSFQDVLTPVALGESRLSIVNVIRDSGGIDVYSDQLENALVSGVAFDQMFGPGLVTVGGYTLSITPAGGSPDSPLIDDTPFSFVSGTSQMLVVYGTSALPEMLLLTAPVLPSAEESGFVRLTHAVAGADAVDVAVEDTLIAPDLSFGQSTEHVALPAGTYPAEIRAAGTTTVLAEAELIVEAGTAATIAAIGTPEEVQVAPFVDDIAGISPDAALISLINTIPGESSVTVTLADGTTLAEDLAFGEISDAVSVDPSTQAVTFSITLDGETAEFDLPAQKFYGGVYYNGIVFNATTFSPPVLTFAPTSLAQGIGSAPGAENVPIAVAQVVEVTEAAAEATVSLALPEVTQAVEAAQATAIQATAEATTPAPATAAPTQTVAPTPTPVVVTPEPLPTARIVLDPGVNLQLRQFPSSEALSLGLAPSGTILTVNGREGAPVDLEGFEITPEPDSTEEAFVDPVTLLGEDEDLLPETTWLNVTFATPDGGAIIAWVNALYVDVRDAEGNRLPLRDLPAVPGNQAGEAVDTAVTPPPVPEDRVTVVVTGLESGVNLNIRRTPQTDGEVLARIPNGTVTEFLGIGESGEWLFVRYVPSDGGSVTGWVSIRFVEVQFNDDPITLDELDVRGLLTTASETDDRGEIGTGTAALPAPTRDPLVDVFVAEVNVDDAANLNLRRTPSDQGEVLARIPTGIQLVIEARTGDGLWLLTRFEDQAGWVAAAFVIVTFNGAAADVEDIPLAQGEVEAETTATPSSAG